MLDGVFLACFESGSIEEGAVDCIEVAEEEPALVGVDGGVVFGDGGVVDGQQIGGESAHCRLPELQVRAFVLHNEVGLGHWLFLE